MRRMVPAVFVMLVVCAFSTRGQGVNESASSAHIDGGDLVVSIATDNDDRSNSLSSKVDLLDTEGRVRTSAPQAAISTIEGRQFVQFRLTIDPAIVGAKDDIAWYRLRYKIGPASGLISLSRLLKDLFELRVIATTNIVSGMDYRVRVQAINTFTLCPVKDVEIDAKTELELADESKGKLIVTTHGRTDDNGFAALSFAVPMDERFDGDGLLTVNGRLGGLVREVTEDLSSMENDVQVLMMSDKPIYQPEQTVGVRGLVLKGVDSRTVVSGADLLFRIEDEDGTTLYQEKTRSSEYGVAYISWQIPAAARLGEYRIQVSNADDETIGLLRIKISRYDIPNFVVEARAERPYYLPHENTAAVAVNANYLFGKPVAKGRVRVVEEKSRRWDWETQKYDVNEGQVREGLTDQAGTFIAKLDLKDAHENMDDEDYRRFYDMKFAAYYTDLSTNKTEQRRFSVRVTREPIHLYFVGDRYGRNPRFPIDGFITAFYADGTPAKCDVVAYVTNDELSKPKELSRFRTNSFGAAKLSISRPPTGDPTDDLKLAFIARDSHGRKGVLPSLEISFGEDEAISIKTDRTIYKPGDTVSLSLDSTVMSGIVYVDIVQGWSVIDSRFADLKNGHADILVPYRDSFRGQLTLSAVVEDEDRELVSASRGIIFPTRDAITVDASFEKQVYKPDEPATVRFSVVDTLGKALESALGIVVIDRAVEERARTDAEFSGRWQDMAGWLGFGDDYAGVNIKDINELDLTKPISDDLQLVADLILHDEYYSARILHSPNYNDEARSVFSGFLTQQFLSFGEALKTTFENDNYRHPMDEGSLRAILKEKRIDLDLTTDPWGQKYSYSFSVERSRDVLTVTSAGPDKQFGTGDDFAAYSTGFEYFTPWGKKIDAAAASYVNRTGKVMLDESDLLKELQVTQITDPFGRPYRFHFTPEGRNVVLEVYSAGPDGKMEDTDWTGDDFDVWKTKMDYFSLIERKIVDAQNSLRVAPRDESEFKDSLRRAGIRFEDLRDGWGRPLYVTAEHRSRYLDKVTLEAHQNYGDRTWSERTRTTPVTQELVEFTVRSKGKDGKSNTYDDVTLMQITHILAEQSADSPQKSPTFRKTVFRHGTGSIAGIVKDVAGAIVPNVKITATNNATQISGTTKTDSSGAFLITNLAAGTYSVDAAATSGFVASTVSNVAVNAGATTYVNVELHTAATAEVTVTGGPSIDQTSSSVSASRPKRLPLLPEGARLLPLKGGQSDAKFTPRLREYFPETLVWQPELITDKKGRAEMTFKMADNITTWKVYAIASTKKGKIGVVEKEVTAFQPFFVDLDPPKFLTEGDEIWLPSQVRNYTEKRQEVDVTMSPADWFGMLGPDKQRIGVDPGSSQKAVFGFRAARPVEAGKQRLTAIARSESDAIEKPVTVRPNGEEIVRTDSRVFSGETGFDIDFPTTTLAGTRKAELKIYPNLFSHVTESVEGLLKRPYGCGEQTISSTYPNLMVLRFVKQDSPLKVKASRYLWNGYQRLLGYQAADGGFTYWGGKSEPDVSLTAYAIRFLSDADGEIEVDDTVIRRAQEWLVRQQRADGSWTRTYSWERAEDIGRTTLITSYVARSLAMSGAGNTDAVAKALDYLAKRNAEIDEPYAMAMFGLASLGAGNKQTASAVAERLAQLAVREGEAAYWKLETNTPFYGWGTPGRIETTALVVQLLIRTSEPGDPARQALISKGILFLLKNKDRYGVWYSTQATINVLDTLIAALAGGQGAGTQTLRIAVNGTPLDDISVPADQITPVTVDLTSRLAPVQNHIAVSNSSTAPTMAQMVATHYIDWADSESSGKNTSQSRTLRLDYRCDRPAAAIMQDINCTVETERVGFRGYGMLLAEIGLPPGADVSRESLERAAEADWSVSHYDILPDRIVLYLWARPGGSKLSFSFRPRYAINAQTPASVVYDYYNPEARAVERPLKFAVR